MGTYLGIWWQVNTGAWLGLDLVTWEARTWDAGGSAVHKTQNQGIPGKTQFVAEDLAT